MKAIHKILLVIILVILCVGGYLAYSFLSFINELGGPDQVEFQQDVWIEHNDLDEIENPRGAMIDDLFNNYLTEGMHRNKVIELLEEPYDERVRKILKNGEADSLRNRFDESAIASLNQLKKEYGDPDTLMLYPIGWYSGFGIDPDFLAVRINNDSITVDFWTEQH